jgi:hypothetical protein
MDEGRGDEAIGMRRRGRIDAREESFYVLVCGEKSSCCAPSVPRVSKGLKFSPNPGQVALTRRQRCYDNASNALIDAPEERGIGLPRRRIDIVARVVWRLDSRLDGVKRVY